jgi:hypothetical protein
MAATDPAYPVLRIGEVQALAVAVSAVPSAAGWSAVAREVERLKQLAERLPSAERTVESPDSAPGAQIAATGR